MTHISAVDMNKTAVYNAVKIQINDPKTTLPNGLKNNAEDNGVYNAVNIEVNRPSVEMADLKPIYSYPKAKQPVTSDMAGVLPIQMPELPALPVAYQTNFINNKTLVNAEIEIKAKKRQKADKPQETVGVPLPNVTTIEAEKNTPDSKLSFKGLSFRAEKKQEVEIIPPVEIKPEVDVPTVIANLESEDFDVQAQQMEEIARVSMEDPQKAVPYVVTDIFTDLINIVEKDTSNLNPPSEKQIETRKKIIINQIVKEQAAQNKQDLEKVELPYSLTKEEIAEASALSPLEQAERNKEYSLYTMAILAKVYTDEVQKQTGNIVPLTDLPGVSSIVDALRNNENSGIKVAAIDALRYIYRPEYKDELKSVLTLSAQDQNPYVARNAALTLESIEK